MNPADSGSAAATIAETLEQHYPGRVLSPKSLAEIPAKDYLVYVLEHNGRAIVVGHGKKNRARVILDSEEAITPSHLKAIFVRLHHLFPDPQGGTRFAPYLVTCKNKEEAKAVEKALHALIHGNDRELPDHINRALFAGIPERSIPWMLLKMALASSYDGLGDLRRWRIEGIIDDDSWKIVGDRLRLGAGFLKARGKSRT